MLALDATIGTMMTTAFSVLTRIVQRILLAAVVVAPFAAPGAHAADRTLKADYLISIAGITIGKVNVEGRFTSTGYAATISGQTYGISRFISDAHAVLAGNGRILGTHVTPASYQLDTDERGFRTHVSMAMRGGSIVDLSAAPHLVSAPDRVPVTPIHKRNVVDPVGAFMVAIDRPLDVAGPAACNRTVRIFDGWQRYDVKLTYKDSKHVNNSDPGAYSGEVFICAARYVPVAGHRPDRDSVQYMAHNKRLEVWLVPVDGTRLLVPYRILIGTQMGDLVIIARDFAVSVTERQASAN
jgi:hypothetical protein